MDIINLGKSISIPFYSDYKSSTLGLDSLSECFDRRHYKQYPVEIDYQFNRFGYRGPEPEHYVGNEILAIGDSFTLGLGSREEDRWTNQLENLLQYPVINFSLNGASNDWMARRTADLLKFFTPRAIVLHYSFSHRRERSNIDLHDNERTECEPFYSDDENLTNWLLNFTSINQSAGDIPIIHSFIPNWHTQPVDYKKFSNNLLPPMPTTDLARDGFHYGHNTQMALATEIAKSLTILLVSE